MQDGGRNMRNLRIVRTCEGWSRNGLSGQKVHVNVNVTVLES
jgi:hypothetical protein